MTVKSTSLVLMLGLLVKLDHKGFYRLAVDHRAPSKYPDSFAYDDYTASLVFTR